VALLVFALLLGAVSGYWYLTNDSRIRRQVRRYLRDITGAQVSVERAHFSIFGEIRVHRVRVDVPGDKGRPAPFFSARTLVLKHRPWSVFVSGRIEPTQIIPVDASVTNSPHTREFLRLRGASLSPGPPSGQWAQPVIHIENLQYEKIDVVRGIALPPKKFRLEAHMFPKAPGNYDVFVAHRQAERVEQEYRFNVEMYPTFKATIVSGSGDLMAAADALPQEYSKWLDVYEIKGRQEIVGPVSVSENSLKGVLELKLIDVSFKLPKDQGGLSLSNVKGTLFFTFPDESAAGDLKNGRIEMRGIVGRLAEAGDATIRLSGAYHGFRADSPFDVRIEIDKMTLPPGSSHQRIDGTLKHVKRMYRPSGRMDLRVHLRRDPGRKTVSVTGTVLPKKGMSAEHISVPYRLEYVSGEIHFTDDRVVVKDLVGTREGGKFTINADVSMLRDPETRKWDGTVRIDIDSARMTDAMSAALPPGMFVGKPYPLRNVKGTATVAAGRIWVDQDNPLRARGPGDMRCTIYGRIHWPPKHVRRVSVDAYIKADDVPLDRALRDSLDKAGRHAMGLLSPSGTAERVSLEIHHAHGKKLAYRIDAGLRDVSITYKGFPYGLTGIKGSITIEPDLVSLSELTGRHGRTPVTLAGRLHPGSKEMGVNLTAGADGLVLDDELYRALPSDLKKIWDGMAPSGQADVRLVLRQNLPKDANKTDYRLEVRPKGMTVTYKGFPYEFRGVTGEVVARPDLVVFRDLKCARGYRMSGTVLGGGRKLNLKIHAQNVPIDKKLLAALPDALKATLKTIRPGGRLDLALDSLTVIPGRADQPATAPAGKPVAAGITAVTTRPAGVAGIKGRGWAASGTLTVHDTTVDVAFGAKKVSGNLYGTVRQDSRGLAIDAGAAIDKIIVGRQLVTDVRGRISKKAGSPLVRIEDLEARAYGGRLAGREAMIRLSEPVRYAFNVFYENVSLNELANAGVTDPAKRTDVRGRLEGKISLEETVGAPKSRKAAGTVTITRGKLYKMPIVLGVMHVLYLSLPGDAAFTDGHLKYFIQGDTMVIEEVFLTGSALSLVGSGTMMMSTEKLDLTFLAGPPGQLPRIQVIQRASKVLKAILKELLIVRVTGTLSKPVRKEVLLRSVDAILKELLSPGRPRT